MQLGAVMGMMEEEAQQVEGNVCQLQHGTCGSCVSILSSTRCIRIVV